MNGESLERLMIDRALGGLSPDVDALLGAYLESHTTSSEEARELEYLVETAKRAVAGDLDRVVPPPRFGRPGRGVSPGPRSSAGRVASLAAGLLIGVGLGLLGSGRIGSVAPNPPDARGPAPSEASAAPRWHGRVALAQVDPAGETDAFWSARRFVAAAARPARPPSSGVRRGSPASLPSGRGNP